MSLLKALNLPAAPAAAPAAANPASAGSDGRMGKAAAGWRDAQRQAEARIGLLKDAVLKQAGDQPDAVRQSIEQGLKKLDGVIEPIASGLGEALAAGSDPASRQAARDALGLVVERIKAEPLIAHIDANPYGVKTDVKGLLQAALVKAAQAIG